MEVIEHKHSLLDPSNFNVDLFKEEQSSALNKLQELDFPSTRVEEWKYTRVGKIASNEWSYRTESWKDQFNSYRIPGWKGSTLLFINGEFQEEQSEIKEVLDGAKLKPMSKACENCQAQLKGHFGKYSSQSENIFDQMNSASWKNGLFLYLPKDGELMDPVHVISIVSGENVALHMRNVIILEEGAKANVVMSFIGADNGKSYQNAISEISVDKNASLGIDKIQISGKDEFQMISESVDQAKDSRFTINTITADAAWVRNDLKIQIQGENCETNLYGVYLPVDGQHVDNHTVVDHQKAHCNSNEWYKGVIYDKATGVFNGKVFVRQDAQKTNAFQANNNIVMNESASMNSKPELEIYADDVKCSHGSTTGQFDEEAVFYLRARGISEVNARKLLVQAFLSDALDNVQIESVKEYVENLLDQKQAKILS